MGRCRFLAAIVGVVITLTTADAATSDPPWSLSDDSLFSDIESLPSSENLITFNQPDLFFDSGFPSSDGPQSFLEETGSGDDLSIDDDGLDGSLALVDCSSSEAFPVNGGPSRIRRRDVPAVCTDAGTGPRTSSDSVFKSDPTTTWDDERDHSRPFSTQGENPRRMNENCRALTFRLLPWGVCYKPTELALTPTAVVTIPPAFTFLAYDLAPCRLGTCPCALIGLVGSSGNGLLTSSDVPL